MYIWKKKRAMLIEWKGLTKEIVICVCEEKTFGKQKGVSLGEVERGRRKTGRSSYKEGGKSEDI